MNAPTERPSHGFDLPAINVPYPVAEQPALERAVTHANQWARDVGLLPDQAYSARFEADRLGELAALSYVCTGIEPLILVSEWMAWFFGFDDSLDITTRGRDVARTHAYVTDVARVLHLPPGAALPHGVSAATRALAQLWSRSHALAHDPSWTSRMRVHLLSYLYAYRRQAVVNSTGELMSEQFFALQHRQHSSAGIAAAMLIEPSAGLRLTAEQYAIPEVRSLYEIAGRSIAWVNDVTSFANETAVGDHCNYLTILQHTRDVTRQQGADRIARHAQGDIDCFVRLHAELPDIARLHGLSGERVTDLDRWATALGTWMSGMLAWHGRTPRYQVSRARVLATTYPTLAANSAPVVTAQ